MQHEKAIPVLFPSRKRFSKLRLLPVLFLVPLTCWGQTSTGNAKTSGPCSPAISGNNNRVTIKNCKAVSGAKIEQPAFHEKSGEAFFSLGENGITSGCTVEQLRRRTCRPFVFDNDVPLKVGMSPRNDTLLFSFKLLSPSGQPSLEIDNNEFKVNIPGADWNYNANALEVVNAKGTPIFQFVRKNRSEILIKGVFITPSGLIIVADDTGMSGQGKFVPGRVVRAVLKPIFKYPAWKYPGKYADGTN